MTAALRHLAFAVLAALALSGPGCAEGGKGDGPLVDAGARIDGTPLVDAPRAIDAAPDALPDAAVSMTPDAGSGLFCTANSQCTIGGECCLTLGGAMGFCAPGTVILNECVPF